MFISLLAAGATAATVAAAPVAVADSGSGAQPTCYQSGPGTQCQMPGNVQLDDAPPPARSLSVAGGETGLLGGGGARP